MLSQNQVKVLYLYVVYWLLVGWCKTGYFFCMTGLKYSFSGYGDEGSSWWRWWWVSTTMATGPCGSKSVLKNLSFGLIILVRFDHSELLRQNSGKGGGAGSHFISPLWEERKEGGRGGNKRSSPDYQDCREKSDNSHLVRQGSQLFCVWGRQH
jgi:hypothetical protein